MESLYSVFSVVLFVSLASLYLGIQIGRGSKSRDVIDECNITTKKQDPVYSKQCI